MGAFWAGSGSTYIYGWVDSAWRDGMTREECEEFAIKAVSLAIARDGERGDNARRNFLRFL